MSVSGASDYTGSYFTPVSAENVSASSAWSDVASSVTSANESPPAKSVRFAVAENPPPYQRYEHPASPPIRTRRYFIAMADRYVAMFTKVQIITAASAPLAITMFVAFFLGYNTVGIVLLAILVAILAACSVVAFVAVRGRNRYRRWISVRRPPKYVYINRRFSGTSNVSRETRVDVTPRDDTEGWTSDRRAYVLRDAWLDVPCRIGDTRDWVGEAPTIEDAYNMARA